MTRIIRTLGDDDMPPPPQTTITVHETRRLKHPIGFVRFSSPKPAKRPRHDAHAKTAPRRKRRG